MKIEYMRECVDLAGTLSFTKTSENMFVAQPALSKHISSLEKELGFPIFERTKRKVLLTRLGALFIKKAKAVLAAYDEMTESIAQATSGISSVLRIGYLRGAIGSQLSRIQARFSAVCPDVEVEYITYEFHEIGDALEGDQVDLIVASVPGGLPRKVYDVIPLFEDTYFAAFDVHHPLADKEIIGPDDLSGQIVALPSTTFYSWDNPIITDYLDPKAHDIEIRRSVRDINSLFILLQSFDQVGITFGHLKNLYNDEIALVPLRDFDYKVEFGVIWKKGNANDAIRTWADIAKAQINVSI